MIQIANLMSSGTQLWVMGGDVQFWTLIHALAGRVALAAVERHQGWRVAVRVRSRAEVVPQPVHSCDVAHRCVGWPPRARMRHKTRAVGALVAVGGDLLVLSACQQAVVGAVGEVAALRGGHRRRGSVLASGSAVLAVEAAGDPVPPGPAGSY